MFESNLIERVGTQHLSETRVILETLNLLRPSSEGSWEEYAPESAHHSHVRNRTEREVGQHWSAFWAIRSRASLAIIREHELSSSGRSTIPQAMLTELWIQQLQVMLAEGLNLENAFTGRYRNDHASAGNVIEYPAPERVPAEMATFVREANSRIQCVALGTESVIRTAAWVSFRFVKIHPFPDFNGRISRLLANLVLDRFGMPFPVVLRGTGQGTKRYRYALERADRGNLDPYAALIAMSLVESFEELDEHLVREGLGPLVPRPND